MSSTKPSLAMFTAAKGNASAAPLSAPPPVPVPANADQKPAADPAQAKATVPEIGPPKAKPGRASAATQPAPETAEDADLVPLGVRCSKDYRTQLKIYAATIRKSMQDVVLEGIELHRQKHGKR